MSWRDRDGELYAEDPAWLEPRGPSPADPHAYRPDGSGVSCDRCGLPSAHPRHLTEER